MNLFLQNMVIENFKGIKHAEYVFGHETQISGCNASGKSSIVDAYCWLLFNKDARGNAPGSDKFHEKPLDTDGKEIHNVDTMVIACFKLDGEPFTLKRVQRENWVKKRGSAEATYQGNTSTYWINSVETKAVDYAERINGITNGDVFMLISALGAFNALDWKKRRALLLGMSGIDVDAELLARDEYAAIRNEVSSLNIGVDDLRKVLNERKRDISKELTLIPARIDEARRMCPQYTDNDIKDAEYNIADASSDLSRCETMIAQMQAGNNDSDASIPRRIFEIEQQIISIKRSIADEFTSKANRLREEAAIAAKRLQIAEKAQKAAAILASDAKLKASESAKALSDLRAEYKRVYAEKFSIPEVDAVCPTCGQEIPEKKRTCAIELAREAFNADKTKRLEEINKRGQKLKAQDAEYRQADIAAAEALEKADAEVVEAQHLFDSAKNAVSNVGNFPDVEADERIAELSKELFALKEKRHTEPDERLKQLVERKNELQQRIDRAKEIIAKRDRAAEINIRISELEAMQTELGQRRADAEVLIYDLERFAIDRCSLLEESINNKFPTIRWKLFDTQINGAIVDCCECMIPGDYSLVAYDGTNTAAAVNADIEIIKVLSEHYNIVAPIFVDNAERVNYIAKPAGQLITLSVSNDKTLKIQQFFKEVA